MACLNISCGVTLVDKHWLFKRLLGQNISTMSTSFKVRGMGTSKHKSSEFATLSLSFPGRNVSRNLVYAALRGEIHLVKDLRANLLISNNIISPERIIINLEKKTALIGACKVIIDVNTKQRG